MKQADNMRKRSDFHRTLDDPGIWIIHIWIEPEVLAVLPPLLCSDLRLLPCQENVNPDWIFHTRHLL